MQFIFTLEMNPFDQGLFQFKKRRVFYHGPLRVSVFLKFIPNLFFILEKKEQQISVLAFPSFTRSRTSIFLAMVNRVRVDFAEFMISLVKG